MLTVPKGGVIAGRSADIRIEAPDTGTVFAALGDRMLAQGQKLKAERDTLTGQRTQLDIARDLGLARQEVEQISDPVVMGSTWEQRSAEIRALHLDRITDPALRERMDLSFTELDDRHSLAVGNRGIALTQSQRGALWIDQRSQITSEAADADPETLGAFMDLGNAAIDNRMASGDLTPEEAAKERQSFRNEVYAARAATAITRDPAQFLTAAGNGDYDSLGGDKLTDFRLSAEREVARRADAAAKAAEVAAADRLKAVGNRLDVIGDIAKGGLTASDEAFMSDPEAVSHPGYAKAKAAIKLRNDMPGIQLMTPAQLDAEIAAEKATPKIATFEADRLTALEGASTARTQEIGTRLTAITGLAGKGLTAIDEAFLADPFVQAHPKFAEAAAAINLRTELPNIQLLTPAQIDAAIVAERTTPKTDVFEANRLAALEEASVARTQEIGTRLTAITGLAGKGLTAIDEAFLADPFVQAHPKFAEAAAAINLRTELPNIQLLTPAQIDAAIMAERTTPKTDVFEANRLTALEETAKAKSEAIGARLTAITGLAGKGLTATDEAFLADPFVQSHPKFGEAAAAINLRTEKPTIKLLTPAEIEVAIAAEVAAPKTEVYEGSRLAALEAHRDATSAAWGSDPVATGLKLDSNLVAPMPDLATTAPAQLASFISGRVGFDDWQRKKGYSTAPGVFSDADRAALKPVLDPTAPVGPKVALAAAILSGAGPQAKYVALQAGADPVFARALRIMGDGGDPSLAAAILTGQQKDRLGTITQPPKGKRQMLFAGTAGGAFSDNPTLEAEIFDAASALYAADAAGVNPDGSDTILPFDEDTDAQDLFKTAVLRVSGAQADRNGQLTIGGLQEINGRSVVLPRGVAREVVDDAWDDVGKQLKFGTWSPQYKTWQYEDFATSQLNPFRAFEAASHYPGTMPDLSSKAAVDWSTLQLRRVGESGVYTLVRVLNGRETTVAIKGDPNGAAYRFRLTDLIKGARQ